MWNKVRFLYFINNWVYTTNHKRIAVNYFWFVILAGVIGMVLATIIRLELAYPGVGIFAGDSLQYLSMVTAHGVIMVFFMIMPLMFGAFGNFLLPTQLGVHDVAFPRLNSAAFWFLPAGLLMLAQLVCIDRRYQRMNCFNIREVQAILKSKFFSDLFNTHEFNHLLDKTMLNLKYKTNDINVISPNFHNFYNFGISHNKISKKQFLSSNKLELQDIEFLNPNKKLFQNISKKNFGLSYYFNFLWTNFIETHGSTPLKFKDLNFEYLYNSVNRFLNFLMLLKTIIFTPFWVLGLLYFSVVYIIKNTYNYIKSFVCNFEWINARIAIHEKIKQLYVGFINIYWYIYDSIEAFYNLLTKENFSKFIPRTSINWTEVWNFLYKYRIAIFVDFSQWFSILTPIFVRYYINLFNQLDQFYSENIFFSYNKPSLEVGNKKQRLDYLTNKFSTLKYHDKTILNQIEYRFNYTSVFVYFDVLYYLVRNSIKNFFKLISNTYDFKNMAVAVHNFYYFFIQWFLPTLWLNFGNIFSFLSLQEIGNLFGFQQYFKFIYFFFTILRETASLFFINIFYFVAVFVNWIINYFKTSPFGYLPQYISFKHDHILINSHIKIYTHEINEANIDLWGMIYDSIFSFFSLSYRQHSNNITRKFNTNWTMEILKAYEESTDSYRHLNFNNPIFKYDYKSGDYFPKTYRENFNYLYTSLINLTSGLRTAPWFLSYNFDEIFNQTTKLLVNQSRPFYLFEVNSKFTPVDGFYNFFTSFNCFSNDLNTRWVSFNTLNQKFYNMFITSSMQQRIYSNWRQLKFTREAWRCKLLAARNQKTLFRRYVNEDGVFWSIERNARDLLPGWAMITPFSSRTRFTAIGKVDIGLMGVLLVLNSSIISGANFLVTYRYLSTLNNRKMRDARSFFTEGVMVTSWMMIAANPMLVIGIIMLLSDRHWQTSFFDYSGGGDTILFQHMFWFFGHPEVYIIMIPVFGFVNTLISYYLRKRVSARASLLYSMYTIAFLGFFVWGHHMYMVGLAHTTRMLFSTLTVMISVPAATKLMHWCVTIANSAFTMELPFLFVLTFIFLFVSGGISGMFVAHTGMDVLFHDTFYVIGHFHVMFAGAAMFGAFGAFYFYFPAIFGVKYSRIYSYLHYIYYLIGQMMTVVPMFWLGYAGMPRRVLDYPASLGGWHSVISAGHMLSVAGLIAFFIMIFDSLRQARAVVRNTFGINRYNTRLNFYLFEIARLTHIQRKYSYLYRYVHFNSLKLNKKNYQNWEHLETTLFSYSFTKK